MRKRSICTVLLAGLLFAACIEETVENGDEQTVQSYRERTDEAAFPSKKPTRADENDNVGSLGLKANIRSIAQIKLVSPHDGLTNVRKPEERGVLREKVRSAAAKLQGRRGGAAGLYGNEELIREFLIDLSGETNKEFQLIRDQKDKNGHTYLRLQENHEGIPVFGADIVVSLKEMSPVSVAGRLSREKVVETKPSITPREAKDVCREFLRKEGLEFEASGAVESGDPSLIIISERLAYKYVVIYTRHDGETIQNFFVDAHSGMIIYSYQENYGATPEEPGTEVTVSGERLTGEGGGEVEIGGWKNVGFSAYFLYSFANGWGIYDMENSPSEWVQNSTDDWGTSDRRAISVANNIENVLAYFKEVWGRESYDDQGSFLKINLKDELTNAYWLPSSETISVGDGDGNEERDGVPFKSDPLGVQDVMGHEFGHGTIQFTSGLVYTPQESGALNEGYADIIGTTIEFRYQPDGTDAYGTAPHNNPGESDWLIGEDCWTLNYAMRNMREPHDVEDPSYYQGTYWDSAQEEHNNANPLTHAFYLLSEGGSGTNDGHAYGPIDGIGVNGASEIAIGAVMYEHTSNDGYSDARDAWLESDMKLGGKSIVSVMRTFEAIGVGTDCSTVFDTGTIASGTHQACSIVAEVPVANQADVTLIADEYVVNLKPGFSADGDTAEFRAYAL